MTDIADVLLKSGIIQTSKSEARRYIMEKRVKVNGELAQIGQKLVGVCKIQFITYPEVEVDIDLLEKLCLVKDKLAGDEYMGKWIYCKQHLRPHSTGWCTVGPYDKIPLKAEDMDAAYAEVRANGWKIYGEEK